MSEDLPTLIPIPGLPGDPTDVPPQNNLLEPTFRYALGGSDPEPVVSGTKKADQCEKYANGLNSVRKRIAKLNEPVSASVLRAVKAVQSVAKGIRERRGDIDFEALEGDAFYYALVVADGFKRATMQYGRVLPLAEIKENLDRMRLHYQTNKSDQRSLVLVAMIALVEEILGIATMEVVRG